MKSRDSSEGSRTKVRVTKQLLNQPQGKPESHGPNFRANGFPGVMEVAPSTDGWGTGFRVPYRRPDLCPRLVVPEDGDLTRRWRRLPVRRLPPPDRPVLRFPDRRCFRRRRLMRCLFRNRLILLFRDPFFLTIRFLATLIRRHRRSLIRPVFATAVFPLLSPVITVSPDLFFSVTGFFSPLFFMLPMTAEMTECYDIVSRKNWTTARARLKVGSMTWSECLMTTKVCM